MRMFKFSDLTKEEQKRARAQTEIFYCEERDCDYVWAEETVYGLVFRSFYDLENENQIGE